jgi:hypothetical protein
VIVAELVGCVVDKPENEVRFLLIVTERLRPGSEEAYNEKRAGARAGMRHIAAPASIADVIAVASRHE